MSDSKVKKVAGIIAIVLTALIVLPLLVTILSGSASAAVSEAELKKLKEQASALSKESNKIASELKSVRASKSSAIKEKNIIDNQISVLEQEIETTNLIIQNLSEQIAEKEREIEKAEEEEAREFELFKKRVRAMEENGTTSYLAVLLKCESFSELLCKTEVISEIIEYDKLLLASLKATRERIEKSKAELELDRAEQGEAREVLLSQLDSLEIKYQEQNEIIKNLEKDEETYASEYEAALKEMERVNKEIAKMAAELAKRSKYVGGEYLWPLPTDYTKISSQYGNRMHPILKKVSFHSGIDIPAPNGTAIYAANSGEVIVAGWNTAYGNYVVINHGGSQTTLYAHMSKYLVKKGQQVKRGDKIGQVGSTGWSTGPHLHFEISVDGKTKDPETYFKKK